MFLKLHEQLIVQHFHFTQCAVTNLHLHRIVISRDHQSITFAPHILREQISLQGRQHRARLRRDKGLRFHRLVHTTGRDRIDKITPLLAQ
jgi:hypothetical protein